ncbi:MAG: hypothetical protein IPK52_18025 [Chloroflexi bacterium]|nr:hypothetical protein [Chloroflexota bacterium]
MSSVITACVRIEDFGVASQDIGGSLPVVLVDYRQRRAKIAAASASARAAGVQSGMSLTRARAVCPNLTAHPFKPERVDGLRDRCLNTLWTYTNRIEMAPAAMPQSAVFWLDLGLTRDDDASRIGEQIYAALSRIGLRASVGMARGKFTAHAAAQHAHGVTLIPRGEDAAFLDPLPVGLLGLVRETARKLDLLGIRTLGQFAALPRSAVSAQFGRKGRLWHLLATGKDTRPVVPFRMPEFERAGFDFDGAVEDLVVIDHALNQLALTLAQRLESRSSAAHEVALTLHFERGATRTERIQRVQPFADCAELRRTLFALLDKAGVDSPVGAVSVTLNRLAALTLRQLELFTQKPRKQAILDLAAALTERYGTHFYTAEVVGESLLPERRFRLVNLRKEGAS